MRHFYGETLVQVQMQEHSITAHYKPTDAQEQLLLLQVTSPKRSSYSLRISVPKKKVGLQQVAIQITIKSPYIRIMIKGFQDYPHDCHSDRQLSTDYMFIFHPIN
jgi:hypothetical protein